MKTIPKAKKISIVAFYVFEQNIKSSEVLKLDLNQ